MIDTIIKQNNMWFPRMQEKVNEFLTQFHPQSQGSRTNESNTKCKAFQNLCTNRPELGNSATNSPNGDKGKYKPRN